MHKRILCDTPLGIIAGARIGSTDGVGYVITTFFVLHVFLTRVNDAAFIQLCMRLYLSDRMRNGCSRGRARACDGFLRMLLGPRYKVVKQPQSGISLAVWCAWHFHCRLVQKLILQRTRERRKQFQLVIGYIASSSEFLLCTKHLIGSCMCLTVVGYVVSVQFHKAVSWFNQSTFRAPELLLDHCWLQQSTVRV